MHKEKVHKNRPILSMLSFTSSVVFSKASTWVVFGIFTFLIIVVSVLPSILSLIFKSVANNPIDIRDEVIGGATIIITYILPSLISFSCALQGVLRGINIFRDCERDGFEIILVTKPITRKQIVFSRFIFLSLYGLSLSVINFCIISISILINGVKFYNNTNTLLILIFGTFLGSFFAFLVMGLFAITIGIIANNKTSTIVPVVTLFLSGFIASGLNSGSFFIPNSTNFLNEMVINKINNDIKNKDLIINFTSSTNKNEIVTSITQTKFMPKFITFDISKKVFWLNGNILFNTKNNKANKNDYFNYCLYLKSNNESSSQSIIDEQNITLNKITYKNQTYSNINNSPTLNSNSNLNNDAYNFFINTYLKSIIININYAPANGLVALNYLNPSSAFSAICGLGINIDSPFNNIPIKSLPYDYSISNFKAINLTNNDWTISFNMNQMDPFWAVCLVWILIIILMSSLNIFVYYRKDFK